MKRLMLFLGVTLAVSAHAEEFCSYQTYSWNTITRKAVNYRFVKKPLSNLSSEEMDEITGCRVCEEDQEVIDVPPVKPFKVCRVLAPRLRQLIEGLVQQGEPIYSVTGYRVGRTRGDIDAKGNRTGFSNHSYGVAIDINADQNGLYDQCIQFDESCHLIKGGPWNPEATGSLTVESNTVKALQDIGLKWGGQISGKQKDFMHFSATGY